ncbi:MAG: organoarsenical effux MFS transporter ArsJ [Pseudomonadota bacterium]|nr:organoarsenical effux MFS transporter ArsJ [Pseudomonadota bacterium]
MTDIRSYIVVTASYWGFTLTDGALRMLVLLYFHTLGYSPLQLASLFLLYELMGIITNLLGGWIGARVGIKITLFFGLILQIIALMGLSALDNNWSELFSLSYVLVLQGLSGVAKDLCKMSSKSAVKIFASKDNPSMLFKLVSVFTGSKNALKGVGFFLGGLLLASFGFVYSLWIMAGALGLVSVGCALFFSSSVVKTNRKAKPSDIFSNSGPINKLSAARVFLFGARDMWFVVALPIFLYEQLNWGFSEVGSFLALWVIGYGVVQSCVPTFIKSSNDGLSNEVKAAKFWIIVLFLVTAILALSLNHSLDVSKIVMLGLAAFGLCFAINSSIHSYLILGFTSVDKVTLSVGFYYSANASGRLIGTFLSGITYQLGGLQAALYASAGMLLIAVILTIIMASSLRRLEG